MSLILGLIPSLRIHLKTILRFSPEVLASFEGAPTSAYNAALAALRVESAQDAALAADLVAAAPEANGLPPYGQRMKKMSKPGGAHSGVDEMGFSTAWHNYDDGSAGARAMQRGRR